MWTNTTGYGAISCESIVLIWRKLLCLVSNVPGNFFKVVIDARRFVVPVNPKSLKVVSTDTHIVRTSVSVLFVALRKQQFKLIF